MMDRFDTILYSVKMINKFQRIAMDEVDDFKWFYCKFNFCMSRVQEFLEEVSHCFKVRALDRPKTIMKCCEAVFRYYAKGDRNEETRELLYKKLADLLKCSVDEARHIIEDEDELEYVINVDIDSDDNDDSDDSDE